MDRGMCMHERRRFLRQVASGAMAAASAPWLLGSDALCAAGNDRWTMRLSTSTVQFSSLSVEEACARIGDLGFQGVDFWPSAFQCAHLDEIETRLGAEGLKELLAKHNLKICAFTCYHTEYSKYAALLGKASGGVAVRGSREGKPDNVAREMKIFLEGLKPEAELAEKHEGFVAIENHCNGLLDSLDSFKAFVEMNRHPRLGIALAPYHLQAAGISVTDVIKVVGPQLLFFYAWQHASGLEQLPGIGPTDCVPWIANLAAIDYRGYVNPFMHGHPGPEEMAKGLATSRDYLTECYKNAMPA